MEEAKQLQARGPRVKRFIFHEEGFWVGFWNEHGYTNWCIYYPHMCMILPVCSSMLHDIRINIVPVVKEERNDVELEPCEKGDKRAERLACKQPLRSFGIFLS